MTNFKFNRIVKKLAVLLIALSSFLSASLTSFAASDVDTGLYPHTSLAAAATEARKNVIARVNTTSSTSNDFYFTVGYTASSYDSKNISTTVSDRIYAHTGKTGEGDALRAALNSLNIVTSKKQVGSTFYIKVTVYGKYNLTAAHEAKYSTQIAKIATKAYRSLETSRSGEIKTVNATTSLSKSAKSSKIAAINKKYSQNQDYYKALYIYQYVVGQIKYGSTVLSGRRVYNTGYAALNHTATCNGISQLVYDLMNAAGVECRVVRSNAHAWNIVKIGGQWYIVDATYGASVKDSAATKYFLKGTSSYKEWASRMTDIAGGSITASTSDFVRSF